MPGSILLQHCFSSVTTTHPSALISSPIFNPILSSSEFNNSFFFHLHSNNSSAKVMECNKEEAVRVKQLAEMKMMIKDFSGALKMAFRAQQLYPELENISQLIIVCEVNSAAEKKSYGALKDWYGILKVDPSADDMSIKRQYRKLALILHPDKNKFYGSTEAFKLIGEAQRLLLDREKRAILDGKLKAFGKCTYPNLTPKQPKSHFGKFQFTEKKSPAVNCKFTTKQVFEKKEFANMQGNVNMIGKKRKTEPVGSQNFGQLQPRRSTRPKRIVFYNESESRRSVQQVVEYPRRIANEKSKRDKRNTEEEMGPEMIECPDPEFSNFEKHKKEETFSAGQIWACYDAEDAMPRLYAVIKKISPRFMLQIQWLESDPTATDERKWVGQHLPVSCGRFKHGEQDKTQDLLSFSHLVSWEAGQKAKTLNIFPRKGETWAVFKNWFMNWNSGNKGAEERKYEYEFVEVLSDYDEKVGVRVLCLEKVKGFVCLFRRKKGGEMEIAAREKYRFAHMVPSCRMTGKERKGVPKGCYELDPAALPASTF